MKRLLLISLSIILVGCTAAVQPTPMPAPTPEIIVKTVEIPGPTVEVKVPVTPPVCIDALNKVDEFLDLNLDWLNAMIDGKYKKADSLSTQKWAVIDEYYVFATQCRDTLDVSLTSS